MKPDGWGLYIFHCITFVITYGLLMLGGVVLMVLPDSGPQQAENMITGGIFAVLGFPFFAASVLALFVPRKPWGYYYSMAVIAVGLTSCLWWPLCIPLIIKWTKPEMRDWFMGAPRP